MTASPVDEELAAAFARDGVACVRGVLDPAELASAARAIEIVLANPSPIAQLASAADDPGTFDIRRFELRPGDAIFFDFLTVHGAPGFPYPGRRRVLSLRYLSAQARHAPRSWRTSPPFDGLEEELPAGSAMDHPLFPVVWPASSGPGHGASPNHAAAVGRPPGGLAGSSAGRRVRWPPAGPPAARCSCGATGT